MIDLTVIDSSILITDYVETSEEKKRQQKLWSESRNRQRYDMTLLGPGCNHTLTRLNTHISRRRTSYVEDDDEIVNCGHSLCHETMPSTTQLERATLQISSL